MELGTLTTTAVSNDASSRTALAPRRGHPNEGRCAVNKVHAGTAFPPVREEQRMIDTEGALYISTGIFVDPEWWLTV